MIPQTLHQIWLGGKIPPRIKRLMASWRKIHPQWSYKLWTAAEVATLPTFGPIASRVKPYALAADLARVEILYHEGGIYADADIKLERGINYLLTEDLLLTKEPGPGPLLTNCLIGCPPRHPFIEAYFTRLQAYVAVVRNGLKNAASYAGRTLITEIAGEMGLVPRLKLWKKQRGIGLQPLVDTVNNEMIAGHIAMNSWQNKPTENL